jgi:lipopolysaccharide/colanic/teichoic acid biosynthesis glycosyltransferase
MVVARSAMARRSRAASANGAPGPHGMANGVSHLQVLRNGADEDGLAHVRHSLGRRPVSDLSKLFVRGLPPWKRVMDILMASTLLVLLSPLMLAVAVAIKLGSPGPIIFRQKRAGLGGRPFLFLKFRSMFINAEQERKALDGFNEATGPVFKMRQDPASPPSDALSGGLDRRDPATLERARGEMTIVGPRPPILSEVEGYEPWQRHRLDTMGGLTCIWQVSGRSNVEFVDWMRMDLQYIAKRSLLFDLRLLAKTAGAVLSRRGAY